MGQEIIVITWLHEAGRDTLKVHPRGDESSPLAGVFSTRSPDRPNPLGLHRVTVRKIVGSRIEMGPMEAIDGNPGCGHKTRPAEINRLLNGFVGPNANRAGRRGGAPCSRRLGDAKTALLALGVIGNCCPKVRVRSGACKAKGGPPEGESAVDLYPVSGPRWG